MHDRDLAIQLGARLGTPLRGLTLRRPWSSAIFLSAEAAGEVGPKRVENRGTLPPSVILGEFVAIHAGRVYDEVEWPGGIEVPPESECPMGIVGIARVAGALDRRWGRTGRRRSTRIPDESDRALVRELLKLDQDPWWIGPVGWALDNAIAIEPVPCRGALGVWRLTRETQALVWQRVREALERGAR